MRPAAVLRKSPRWLDVLEAAHASAADDDAWSAGIIDAARGVFSADAAVVGMYAMHYGAGPELPAIAFTQPPSFDSAALLHAAGTQGAWRPFHFTAPVLSYREGRAAAGTRLAHFDAQRASFGFGDGLGVVAHPAPGLVTVLHAIFPGAIDLTRDDKRALARVSLHIDAAHRARRRPESVLAELTPDGRITHLERAAPGKASLVAHVGLVEQARSRALRASSDGPALWSALVEGRATLLPRGSGKSARYLVVENEPSSHAVRELRPMEMHVLDYAARGLPMKLVGYALGISPAQASKHLARAAAKMGTLTRNELLRVAAVLAQAPAPAVGARLSDAETEVLDLLERGLSNDAIARERARSVRTIANQVAALLRKTGSRSRRELIARRVPR